MRKKIFDIIEPSDGGNVLSSIYDGIMMCIIVISLTPLAFKDNSPLLLNIDRMCVVIFIGDYILRLITADFKYGKKGILSFVRYPFSFMAIVDLVSTLPSFVMLNTGFRAVRILRIIRAMKVFRVFKAARYSKSVRIICAVFKKSREPLIAVVTIAAVYILISALIVFNVEPDSFGNFFDAVYWATVSLTTMGYGDIYPVTTAGRIVTMISSIFGIAVVALPAGIITAGYMEELNKENKEKEKKEEGEDGDQD